MSLYVDARHAGHFGIGRYAAEVLPRLHLPYRRLDLRRDPMSPLAAFERGWREPAQGDLIYSPGFWPGRSLARQVLTLHDLIHLRGRPDPKQRLYYERLVRPTVLRAGHVLTVSEASADDLRAWLGPDVEVHVTGNGCSAAFRPGGPAREHPRPYVLYVGNAKPHKNVDLLMEALRHLPDLDLVVVSADGPRIARLARAAGVGERVTLVADLDDSALATYYRGAAVLAQPARVEGFGLPALEAVCSGTPVAYLAGCRAVAEVVGADGVASDSATDPAAYAEAVRAAVALGRVSRTRPDWADVADRVRAALLVVDPSLERAGG